MARSHEEYREKVPEVEEGALEGSHDWGPEDGPERRAMEEFAVGLAEREPLLFGEMGRVLGGDTDFKPCWTETGAVGIGAVIGVVDTYKEASAGWSEEQREFVAREVSDVLVKPTVSFLERLEGSEGAERLRARAGAELELARDWYQEAMLNGDQGRGGMARAMLNQVHRDAEGVARGDAV